MFSIKKLITGAVIGAALVPTFAFAQFPQTPGGLVGLGVPEEDLGKLLDDYLGPFFKLLPPDQQRLGNAYRDLMKNYLNTIIPPEVFKDQVEQLRQIERELGGPPSATKGAYTLTIEPDPRSPLPATLVGVRARINLALGGFTPDVQQTGLATFQWWLDNRQVLTGVGQNYYSFTSGAAGHIHALRVRARLANGNVLESAVLIPVADADIVWFADTYAPSGYKGKRLASPVSPITVSVVPMVPASLGPFRFLWTVDDIPLITSAVGADTITLPPGGGDRYVEVRVADLRGTVDISRQITIPTTDPQIVFHEVRTGKHDIATRAVSDIDIAPTVRKTLIARPYFFTANVLQGLRFRWAFDRSELPETPQSPDVFTLNIGSARIPPGTFVEKPLRLLIENRNPQAELEATVADVKIRIQ